MKCEIGNGLCGVRFCRNSLTCAFRTVGRVFFLMWLSTITMRTRDKTAFIDVVHRGLPGARLFCAAVSGRSISQLGMRNFTFDLFIPDYSDT